MVDDCQRYPGLKCLLLRKNASSNLENFTEARKKILKKIRNKFNKFRNTLWFPEGESCVILGHFQNEKDIDKYLGLEYDAIAVEEATTLTRNKYNDIQTCCRTSKRGWRPRMYSTTNPGGIGHAWYRAKFIIPYKAGKETTTRFIPSLVGDNPWNNADYVKILEKLTGWKRRAWFEGDWDIAAGQYFTNFRATSREAGGHIENSFDPNKAKEWILALDHGFNHYTVILLGALCDDGLHIVDEHVKRLTLTPQHVEMVKAMLDRHKIGVETKRGLRLSDIRQFYAGTDIYASERDGKSVHDDYEDHGINWKPASTDRVNGWAEMLKLFGDIDAKIAPRLFIHSRCKRLIDCIPNLQHDPNNPEDVLKWDIDEDGNGGDDTCLIAGTLVICESGIKPIEEILEGEKVLTRQGFKLVTASGQTGRLKKVYKVRFSNGAEITGTGAHPVLTSKGWVRIDALRYNDTVFSCESKKSYSTELNSEGIQTQNNLHIDDITRQPRTIGGEESVHYTKKFGNRNTEESQKVATSITKTKIRLTIGSKILNALKGLTIYLSTQRKSQSANSAADSTLLDRLPPSGIVQPPGKNGIANTSVSLLQKLSRQRNTVVNFAKRNSPAMPPTDQTSFAQTDAKLEIGSCLELMMSKDFAASVRENSQSINTIQKNPARVFVLSVCEQARLDVYNLTVAEKPEFFANGILVHNCDCLRYMVATKAKQTTIAKLTGI